MKLYCVQEDAWDDDRSFYELTDEEIKNFDRHYVQVYDNLESIVFAWNDGYLFSNDYSYMRIIND